MPRPIEEMLSDILHEKDEGQVLMLNKEFERLMLLTEPVINIAENTDKIIVETDVIAKIQKEYNLELKIQEIPLLKKLTKAYYNVDVSKKIVSELAYSLW